MRDIKEITADWPDAPEGLTFLNPSFETVSRELIDAVITEEGIFPPELVFEIVRQKYPWMLEYK
jgi:ribose 1,5-bisphosphate isomerase